MKILVANLGSTSFKYRVYDLGDPAEPLLARGSIERIGSSSAKVVIWSPKGQIDLVEPIADHAAAVRLSIEQLIDPKIGALASASDLSAIGFKAVHARNLTGVHRVTPKVLDAMEAFAEVAPAHNPPYTKAMRMLAHNFPHIPLVAAFETGFHETIPEARRRYAIPEQWANEYGIKKWGFHGASHRYIAGRTRELTGRADLKVVSCHLGGSSSLCAIDGGRSVACSLGMSPQSGLPHNNRVGEFDVFALPILLRETGLSVEGILDVLANNSGLEGVGDSGRDLRDIERAAEQGDPKAKLAIAMFVESVRHYLGAFLIDLGGADLIVFTGGIGENSKIIREEVCRNLEWFGIVLDPAKNASAQGESIVSSADSRVAVYTIPTNEEIVVARQARELLEAKR